MKNFFTLFVLLILFISCDEDEDVCGECNDAIEHMYGKLEENNCNPDFMENAYQRIMEHCGVVNANYVTGFMAHNCQYDSDNFRALNCNEMDGEQVIAKVNINNVDINVTLLSVNQIVTDVTLQVRLEHSGTGGSEPPSALLEAGQTANFSFNNVANGTTFEFTFLDDLDENEVIYIVETKELYFYRPGNWNTDRNITIGWDPILQEYYANWNYW